MAKGPSKALGFAEIDFIYKSVSEMPWYEIETAAGKSFSDPERIEIFECTEKYSWDHDWIAKNPELSELSDLRRALFEKTKDIVELARRFTVAPNESQHDGPYEIEHLSERDKAAIANLNIVYSSDEFDLRDALRNLYGTALQISENLSNDLLESEGVLRTTQKQAKTAGLNAFYKEVISGAESTIARSKQAGAVELKRWGISVGPRSSKFPKFAGAVLRREISTEQIRSAHKAAVNP